MSRYLVQMTWDDVPHLTDEAKAEVLSAYGTNERDARSKGVLTLGAGVIYAIPEEEITIEPFEFPPWYKRSYGLDVGWNRTAAIWSALDPDTDVLYLYSEHYGAQGEPIVHAEAIRARGIWIPGVIDPASRGRSQHDGEQLFKIYTDPNGCRLNLAIADNAVSAGLYQVENRLLTGRLKVFKTLSNWLMEYRIYRRDEKGKIVKENDHLMDATRYDVMSGISRAVALPPELWAGHIPGAAVKSQHRVDYDPMAQMFADTGGGYM